MPNQTDPNQPADTPTDLPPLPDYMNVPPSPTPQTATPTGDSSGSAAPSDLPPVTATPKKKFGGGKIIATILGLFLLVGGIGAGVILTQQQQIFNQKAAGNCQTLGEGQKSLSQYSGWSCTQQTNPGGTLSNLWTCCPPAATTNYTTTQTTGGTTCQTSKSCGTLGCKRWDSSTACSGVCLECNANEVTTGDLSKVTAQTTGDLSKVTAQTTGDLSKVTNSTTNNSSVNCALAGEACGATRACCAVNGLSCDSSTKVCTTTISSVNCPLEGQPCSATKPCCAVNNLSCDSTSKTCKSGAGGGTINGSCNSNVKTTSCKSSTACSGNSCFTDVAGCWIDHYWCKGSGGYPNGCSDTLVQGGATGTVSFSESCGTEQIDIYCPACGMCKASDTGAYISKTWPTTCGGSTPTAPMCVAVNAYDPNWSALNTSQLSALAVGAQINFCVGGSSPSGTFDKAQFTINGVQQPETTTVRPGSTDFCQSYTIQATDTTVSVTAKIHHSTLGWF